MFRIRKDTAVLVKNQAPSMSALSGVCWSTFPDHAECPVPASHRLLVTADFAHGPSPAFLQPLAKPQFSLFSCLFSAAHLSALGSLRLQLEIQ